MKNSIYFLIAVSLFFIACSSDDDHGNSVSQLNSAAEARECSSTHSLIGESRELRVSDTYGISGTVTIVSDCEIEISNFFYNGSGPNVSVYGGTDGNFVSGVNLSVPLNGLSFEGETLNLFLPEDVTFDEINSFSIWCFQFDIDFSSASF